MIAFIVGGLAIGAIIGARLTALAIVPAILGALAMAATAAAIERAGFGRIVVELVLVLVFLEVGYVCAAFTRVLHQNTFLTAEQKSRERKSRDLSWPPRAST